MLLKVRWNVFIKDCMIRRFFFLLLLFWGHLISLRDGLNVSWKFKIFRPKSLWTKSEKKLHIYNFDVLSIFLSKSLLLY